MEIAWGDESIRTTQVPTPVYLLGVFIQTEPIENIFLNNLDNCKPGRMSKLHWRELYPIEKKRSVQAIIIGDFLHVIVVGLPLDKVKPERARTKCLQKMLMFLDRNGIDKLVLESRSSGQDKKDTAAFLRLKATNWISNIDIEHRSGARCPQLWVPDQVLGAYGEHLTGRDNYWALLESSVEVMEIDPR